MRVAVIFFSQKNRDKLVTICKSLAAGIESQGHQVDIVDGDHDVNTKLTIYKYLAIGTESVSVFGGKIPEKVSHFLSQAGFLTGKRSFAFVLKTLFGSTRALFRLMKGMEKEGMYLKYSEILQSDIEAEEIGKRLHIERAND